MRNDEVAASMVRAFENQLVALSPDGRQCSRKIILFEWNVR